MSDCDADAGPDHVPYTEAAMTAAIRAEDAADEAVEAARYALRIAQGRLDEATARRVALQRALAAERAKATP